MAKELRLTKGKVAIVDDADYEWLSQWKWCLHSGGYGCRRGTGGIIILLHRAIMEAPKGVEVDHINRNRLDNRRSNLRLCNRSENSCNYPVRSDSRSGHTGIYWYKAYKKWTAQIMKNGKPHHLGYFVTLEEAIEVRAEAAKVLHGEFAQRTI